MNNVLACEQLSLTQGSAVTLEEMLYARDMRVARQKNWLSTHARPVVSLTLVIPGEVKDSPGARFLLSVALDVFSSYLRAEQWPLLSSEVTQAVSGVEALMVVDAPAEALKRAMLTLEDTHPLGRLWDADVLCPQNGVMSRRALDMAPRRCLLCEEAAHACARSRRHSQAELIHIMEKMIYAYRINVS